MPLSDALSVLAGGLARGYRGSQALKRELSEQRRKALLEERDASTRERLASSQIDLESSRAAELGLAGELGRFNLGEARRRSTGLTRRLLPEGQNFRTRLLGQDLDIEPTYENLLSGDVPSLLKELESQRFMESNPSFYQRFSTFGGGRGRTPSTPAERRAKYLTDLPAPSPVMDTSEYMNQLKEYLYLIQTMDPEAFTLPADSARVNRGNKGNRGGLNLPSRR